jgi:site-specific recombinase XerD
MKQEQIYLPQYKEYLIIKGYASTTTQTFGKAADYFIKWMTEQNITLEQVSYNDVLAFINYKKKQGNKPRTIQLFINSLNRFFIYLVDEHQFNENPASNVIIKGVKRKTLYEILSPEELETIYKTYKTEITYTANKKTPPQANQELARKRNKVMLGLLVYQGIKPEEICKIELTDLQLREGKITIQSSLKTNSRVLKLESHQVFDLYDYINQTRKQILINTKKESTKLFISIGESHLYSNLLQKLTKTLKKNNPKIKTLKHIRTSVITNWLKVHNLRKTQYMAGHRYVSSTEAYQINNIEELQDDIKKYHPIG